MRDEKGHGKDELYGIGAIVYRKRQNRCEPARAYIKVASPHEWIPLSRWRWEQSFGPIPDGMCVHHKDGDRGNDDIDNLQVVSKAEHLEIHRPEFQERAIAGMVATRRRLRWSTKPRGCEDGRFRNRRREVL
jgi:hypothetical protein